MKKNYVILAIVILVIATAVTVVALERGGAFQSETDSKSTLKVSEFVDAKDTEGNRVVIPAVTYTQSDNKETFVLTNSSQSVSGFMRVKTANDAIRGLRTLITFQESGTWMFIETIDIITQRQLGFLVMVEAGTPISGTTVITITDLTQAQKATVTEDRVEGSWKVWGVGNTVTNYTVSESDAYLGFIVLVKSDLVLTHYYNVIEMFADIAGTVKLTTEAEAEGQKVDISGNWKLWNQGVVITSYVMSNKDVYTSSESSVRTTIYDYSTSTYIVSGKPSDPIPVETGRYSFTLNVKYKSLIRMEPYDYEGENMNSNVTFMLSNIYTVSFDAGTGGTGTMGPQTVADRTPTPINVCTFTPPAHKVFDHWDDGTHTYSQNANITLTSNVMLTAVWDDPTVTLDLDGGTLANTPTGWTKTGNVYTHKFTSGTSFSDIIDSIQYNSSSISPTKTGYSFTSWSPNTGTLGDTNETVTATYSANSYVVTLNMNGGTSTIAKAAVTYDSSTLTYKTSEDVTVSPFVVPTKADNDFTGFFHESVKVIDDSGKFIPNVTNYTDYRGNWISTSDVTLTAGWNARTPTS